MSNLFEDKILGKIFKDQQQGKLIERGCLSAVDKKDYEKEIEMDLYRVFIKKIDFNLCEYFDDYFEQNPDKNFESFMQEIRKDNPSRIEALKKINEMVKKIIIERVKGERYRYIADLEIEDQFNIVEKSQGQNFEPSEPKTDFAYDLHATIAEELQLENFDDLEYYTAVNTHLDNCGVDGFFKFKYQNEQGEENFIRVCFDLTTNTPEEKNKQFLDKKRAGEKMLTDITLFLSDDDIKKMREIYRNRKNKDNKDDEKSKKIREEYELLLNIFAKEIINNYKKRRGY